MDQQLQRPPDDNQFIREVVVRICGSLDIDVAMQRCLDYIKDFIPVDGMSLLLNLPGLNLKKVIARASAMDVKYTGARVLPLPQHDWGLALLEPPYIENLRVINDPALEPAVRRFNEKVGRGLDFSLMVMRLELEGTILGELGLRFERKGVYTERHASLLVMLREPFAIAMANAVKHQELIRLKDLLADDNRFLQRQLRRDLVGGEIVGADFGLREVMSLVRQVAPLDSPVMLLGETGVGKEVMANAIHSLSPRRDGPLVKVNCGAIPDTLLDSELFGHEKGAFTGAVAQKRGRFERANGGTIFLDEIGDLPPQAQVRLLHVIQNRVIERVGGTKAVPVDIRIVSATHKNLQEMVAAGQFREDLWFRLNVFPIMIPPLRQRKEDVPALVHHFLERNVREWKLGQTPQLAPGIMKRLVDYDWPGNIRELENAVERALIRCREGWISQEDILPGPLPAAGEQQAGKCVVAELPPLDEVIAGHIRRAMGQCGGKISGPGGAAEALGLHPNTLRKKMDKLGLSYGRGGHRA